MMQLKTQKAKIFLILGVVVILAIVYFLISPLWRNNEANDPYPIAPRTGLDNMSGNVRAQYDQQMKEYVSANNMMTETMPSSSGVLSQADLVASAHDVKGKVLLLQNDNRKILRFENLDTVNGPDLRIYLSAGLDNEDYVDLGAIKANRGNVNYEIPKGTNIDKYRYVLIWCRAFSVLFSYGELR